MAGSGKHGNGTQGKVGYLGAPPAKDDDERERRRTKGENTRARRAMITQHLISELNAVDPISGMTKARMMVIALVELATAKNPDLVAIKEIYDRVEGKARQQVEVTHDGDLNVRSAAVSVLDELVEEATRGRTSRVGKDSLPN